MNIVLSTDNNFVQHCAVTMISILKNTKQANIHFFILTEGLNDKNEIILKEISNKNDSLITIIKISDEYLKGCPMPVLKSLEHISIATYYRLFISQLLPESIDKAIYLDCDIVVRHSIEELWNTSLENYALGAVYQIADWNIEAIKRLGYPTSYGYFNAGVLLINLQYWREHSIVDKFIEFLKLNQERIIYHDQDTLNAVLYKKCKRISCKWNMLTSYFKKNILTVNDVDNGLIINDHADYKEIILKEKNNPVIVHYVSRPKPWNVGCDHPYRNEYYKYLELISQKKIRKPFSLYFFVKNVMKKNLNINPYFKFE